MNIGVIGGDLRISQLVEILKKEGHEITLYGLENCEILENSKHTENIDEILKNTQLILTSIPLSKDGIHVNTMFTNKEIFVNEIITKVKNKKIVTGNINEEIKKQLEYNENEIIDVLKDEELTILNSIPTAEGAIQIAMQESLKTLHGSNCLVLGFGRIGKILAKMLLGIGAKVYCEARKKEDIAWIKSYGYNEIHLKDLNTYLDKFDFIFNTIPYLILDKNNLNLIKKDCLIIDLASKPGGIDFDEANKLNLRTVWALALPGKVAPKTAATYIYQNIKEIINE